MTDNDLEMLTLEHAIVAKATSAADYVAAQLAAFNISRGLATFFETCDVFLSPTLCLPPLRIGEIDTMSKDLSHIAPILRRYIARDFHVQHVRPARDVGAAGLEQGRTAARHDVLGEVRHEATLFRLAGQLEQERPWKNKLPLVCA